jgi:hypothetical protein
MNSLDYSHAPGWGLVHSAQAARNANIHSLTHNAAVRKAYARWNVTDSVLTDAFIPELAPAPAQTENGKSSRPRADAEYKLRVERVKSARPRTFSELTDQ